MTATARTRGPVLAVLPMIQRQARRIASGILLGGLALVLLENLVRSPGQFVSVLLLGITLGSIYALVALGYTLVYGIIELINFAHGDVFMLGGMLVATMVTSWALVDKSGVVLWLFVLLMLTFFACSPYTRLIACVSALSPSGVLVPCALM